MEKIKPFEELTIQDNFLFERVMRNKRLCKKLIETILGIRVKEITYPSFEKAINIRLLSRGIRLDVYVEDDKGHIYNIEMQCSYEKELILARRARYYEALIDNENLEKGQSFAELNELVDAGAVELSEEDFENVTGGWIRDWHLWGPLM